MEEEKIECTGKGVFSLIMGVICLAMAIYLLIITIKMEQVIILAYLVVILAFGLAMYYLLYWKNKKIVMSDNEIIYYPIIGKVRTYSWSDVKKVRYASGGRGSKGRIIIVTDKIISIEEDMKKLALIEKMIKEKEEDQIITIICSQPFYMVLLLVVE